MAIDSPQPAAEAGPRLATVATPGHLDRPGTVGTLINWPYAVAFLVLHALLPVAFLPGLFSWTGVLLVVLGAYVFGTLGINLCYHRLLTHQGFTIPTWLERVLAILGICCLQEPPARWVAVHRMHHQHSDEQPDPHSPLVTFFWGHMGWLIRRNHYLGSHYMMDRYVRDILRDPFYLKLERNLMWVWIYLAQTIVFFLGGFLAGWWWTGQLGAAAMFGLSIVIWGVFVRTVVVWHITWSVNSVTHLWGYRNYETGDNSRNNWFVALTSNGEGWHNNHHADPRSAAHGHRWWEFDVTWLTIRFLELVGLAKNVVRPNQKLLDRRTIETPEAAAPGGAE